MAVGTPTTNVIGGSTPTLTVSVPTGVAIGDIVILLFSTDNVNASITSWPAGFTALNTTAIPTDGQFVGCAWKRLTAADSGSYTITVASATNSAVAAIPLTGRHATNPPVIGTVTTQTTGQASPVTITATGITAVAGDDILHVAFEDQNTASSAIGHSGWTLGTGIVDIANGGGWSDIGVAKAENVAAGATGTKTVTFTLSGAAVAGFATYLISIPAASVAPVNPPGLQAANYMTMMI